MRALVLCLLQLVLLLPVTLIAQQTYINVKAGQWCYIPGGDSPDAVYSGDFKGRWGKVEVIETTYKDDPSGMGSTRILSTPYITNRNMYFSEVTDVCTHHVIQEAHSAPTVKMYAFSTDPPIQDRIFASQFWKAFRGTYADFQSGELIALQKMASGDWKVYYSNGKKAFFEVQLEAFKPDQLSWHVKFAGSPHSYQLGYDHNDVFAYLTSKGTDGSNQRFTKVSDELKLGASVEEMKEMAQAPGVCKPVTYL